jgi:hypothetical protein
MIVLVTELGKKFHRNLLRLPHSFTFEETTPMQETEAWRRGYRPCATCYPKIRRKA